MSNSSYNIPYISHRTSRMVLLGLCQKKIKIDSFLFLKFFSFFIGERLCYLTAWFSRSPFISLWLKGYLLRVYRGKKWKGLHLKKLHIGYKLGSFSRTRILAVFQQAKTRKKKAKSNLIKASPVLSQLKLDKAKKFKGKGKQTNQSLKSLNKAFLGSRWLKSSTDQVDVIV